MVNTPNYTLPYPALSDAPNGPSQIGSLATAIDTLLFSTFAAQDTVLSNRLLNLVGAAVATSETTTSVGTFVALTTAGPSVTLTTRGVAFAIWGAQMWNSAPATAGSRMSVAVSGATTIASQAANAATVTAAGTGDAFRGVGFELFIVNPGSNTFTCQYAVSAASTGSYQNRKLVVWAP
jgi:hypothetical protein